MRFWAQLEIFSEEIYKILTDNLTIVRYHFHRLCVLDKSARKNFCCQREAFALIYSDMSHEILAKQRRILWIDLGLG